MERGLRPRVLRWQTDRRPQRDQRKSHRVLRRTGSAKSPPACLRRGRNQSSAPCSRDRGPILPDCCFLVCAFSLLFLPIKLVPVLMRANGIRFPRPKTDNPQELDAFSTPKDTKVFFVSFLLVPPCPGWGRISQAGHSIQIYCSLTFQSSADETVACPILVWRAFGPACDWHRPNTRPILSPWSAMDRRW